MVKLKSLLLGLMVIGAVAYFGGGGTFASFSAETTNPGSAIASGTLTMSDTVTSVGTCASTNAPTSNNFNSSTACPQMLNLTNIAPGVPSPTGSAEVTIQNTGSIDASKLFLYAGSVQSSLTTALTGGASVSSLPIAALRGAVNKGDSIVVSYGTQSQTFVASAAVAGGATAIPVTAQNAVYAFPIDSSVQDSNGNSLFSNQLSTGLTSGASVSAFAVSSLSGAIASGDTLVLTSGSNTQTFVASAPALAGATSVSVSPQAANFSYPVGATFIDTVTRNTNCYDTKTATAGGSPSKGADLNFNPTVGNPSCGTLLLWVQETTGGKYYCWTGQGSSPESANGLCVVPISVHPSASISSGAKSTISLASVNGNIQNNDTLKIAEGTKSDTLTAGQVQRFATGVTSLTVSGTLANSYTTAAVITDTTAQGLLNSDQANTITNFDTAHNYQVGKIQLAPILTDGTTDTANPVQLSNGASRTFQIGVYMPAGSGIPQNFLQGLQSTFGLGWHIDQ